ncbi:MAG: T9SS type A sorting domain-containing protein [Bacteroidia bacterium]|nr:T9SS type A sorting domain-containing protein [Bacteroidia bacterium]
MKKKLMTIFFVITGSISIFSQSPDWSWIQTAMGNNGNNSSNCMTTDVQGNVYVAGDFMSSYIVIGTDTLYRSGYTDIFIAKYTPEGNPVWAKRAGGEISVNVYSITSDSHSNIYIAGCYNQEAVHFGNITLNNTGGPNFFVAKYTSSGEVVWAKTTSSDVPSRIYAITADSHDNLYVTGDYCFHSIILGNTTLYPDESGVINTRTDLFIAKMDTSGNFIWAKSITGSGFEFGINISADDFDHIFLIGTTNSSVVDFGTGTLNFPDISGEDNYFIARYDTSGNLLWVKNQGSSLYSTGSAFDHNGNYYVTGSFGYYCSPVYFGNDTLINTAPSTIDAFIVKYDSSGNALWARSFGGIGYDSFEGIITDVNNNVCACGWSGSQSVNYDNINVPDSGMIIVKFSPTGSTLWAKNVPCKIAPTCISSWSDSIIYLSGTFRNTVIMGGETLLGTNVNNVYVAKLRGGAKSDVETEPDKSIKIYPNPASGTVIISCLPLFGQIQLINSTGQTIMKKDIHNQESVNINLPASGLYYVRVISGKELITKKVVVFR